MRGARPDYQDAVQAVAWQGQALTPDGEHGYRLWQDGSSMLMQASINESFGEPERTLEVWHDSPYLRSRYATVAP